MGATERVQRFRQRAAEARADAEKMTMPEAKKMLLEVAENFERLQTQSKPTPPIHAIKFQTDTPSPLLAMSGHALALVVRLEMACEFNRSVQHLS